MSYNRSAKPQVKELAVELHDVIDDWDNFVIQLPGIIPAHNNAARADSHGNTSRQKLYMYQKWRDIYPSASWGDVVKALNKAELKDKACELDRKLIPPSAGGSCVIFMIMYFTKVFFGSNFRISSCC